MKSLVIGQGGREHALVKALLNSPSVTEVHCLPGSDGISREAICHAIGTNEPEKVLRLIKNAGIDLVVFGPEQPLAEGLGDFLRKSGVQVVGPSQEAAQLEASKSFAKNFLERHKIPTAKSILVSSVNELSAAAEQFAPPFVLKADGLAAGKGVVIVTSKEELLSQGRLFFEQKILGSAGEKAILEEFMPGWEMSYLILTNGTEHQTLPIAQDHKRLLDKDKGPNTGGMGAVAPLNLPAALEAEIQNQIVLPVLRGLQKDALDYKGILYIGLMVTSGGVKVVEFNVRFGDPEAQVILPLLDGDWGQVFLDLSKGKLSPLKWKRNTYSACVVMAAEGYPESPKKDVVIKGNPMKQTASSYLLHCGTRVDQNGNWLTNGGRVLNSVGVGNSIPEALRHAYSLLEFTQWPGMQFRRDIGGKVLSGSPVPVESEKR